MANDDPQAVQPLMQKHRQLHVDDQRAEWAPTDEEAAENAAEMPAFDGGQPPAHWQQRARLAAWTHQPRSVRAAVSLCSCSCIANIAWHNLPPHQSR